MNSFLITTLFELLIVGCNIYLIAIVSGRAVSEKKDKDLTEIAQAVMLIKTELDDLTIRFDKLENLVQPNRPKLPGIPEKQPVKTDWMEKYL